MRIGGCMMPRKYTPRRNWRRRRVHCRRPCLVPKVEAMEDRTLLSGYTFSKIADTNGSFASFANPSLNDAGTVAYYASLDTGGDGIFTGNGGTTTTVATSGTS